MLYLFIPDWPEYVAGYDGYIYRITTRSNRPTTPVKLTGWAGSSGYLQVYLSRKPQKKKAVLVHRVIATCFLPNPQNLPQVDHIDENKQNNCVSNLQWTSAQQNVTKSAHRISAGRTGKKTKKPHQLAPIVHDLRKRGLTFKEIAETLRYSTRHVMDVLKRYPITEEVK